MWNIWRERNQRIFNNEAQGPVQVARKTQVLMGETLRESGLPKNKIELAIEESNWLNNFNIVV